MSNGVRTPLERAALAVQRAIDRELPSLDPRDRRALWGGLMVYTAKRLREFDAQAEANRGIKNLMATPEVEKPLDQAGGTA